MRLSVLSNPPRGCADAVSLGGDTNSSAGLEHSWMLSVALLAAAASAVIKVGDTLPSVTLDFGFPPEKINLLERATGKNIILMGLPGAFTPT